MNNCPCCSNPMLRHFRLHKTYWFCRQCWQEMPNLNSEANQSILAEFRLRLRENYQDTSILAESVAVFQKIAEKQLGKSSSTLSLSL